MHLTWINFFAASNLGEPLLVDAGKIVVCDQKTLQTVVVDNEEGHYDMDVEKWVVRALKLVSFESHVPALPAEPLSQKVGDDLAVMRLIRNMICLHTFVEREVGRQAMSESRF